MFKTLYQKIQDHRMIKTVKFEKEERPSLTFGVLATLIYASAIVADKIYNTLTRKDSYDPYDYTEF